MALEDLTGTGKFISALNPSWPVDDDWVDEGDNHIRGIKNVLRNTFPNLDGVVTLTDEQLNSTVKAAPDSRIINGNFAIDQRNAGAAVTINNTGGIYAVDRWSTTAVQTGQLSVRREADALFPGEYRLAMTVAVADASITPAADFYFTLHPVEGYSIADLCLGTANARAFTYAFEVESTVAGTFGVGFRNSPPTRYYVAPFTIATANVRQTIVINVPGDTAAATWNRTNSAGLSIFHTLVDSSASTTPNAWSTGDAISVTGHTNFMATAGNTMRLKNARLYPGSIDYGPCQRLYADELRLCQRYYAKSYEQHLVPGSSGENGARGGTIGANGYGICSVPFPQSMRAPPTVTLYSIAGVAGSWTTAGTSKPASGVTLPGELSCMINLGGGVNGDLFYGHWTASAEL